MEIITQKDIKKVAYNLLVRSATKYPANYLKNLLRCLKKEKNWGSKHVIFSILQNIIYASKEPCSICQDTGIPTFHIYFNPQISIKGDVQLALAEATAMATEDIPIRKNVIEPFSFHNPGNNTGWGVPFVHFHYDQQPGPLRIRVELKGFGGEIKSSVDWIFTSTDNMENAVLAYVLNNVLLTKGENCIPGYIGVGVGGYLSEAVLNAKNATYRELTKKTELSVLDLF